MEVAGIIFITKSKKFSYKKSTVECHELGQKIRILGQGQEQDSSVD